MTAENFDQVLAGLMDRSPFQVFTVELHGGVKEPAVEALALPITRK